MKNILIKNEQILLLLVSLVVVIVWFFPGKMFAAGEEGYAIFNNRSIQSQISLWQEAGTGYPMPVYITRIVPVVVVKLLMLLNIKLYVIQAVVYFLIIYSGLAGFYFLAREITKDLHSTKFVSFIASFFYIFNLYSQSQIFQRFLYSSMFLWALLPIFFIFWIRWINTNSWKWLILLILASNLFSHAFSQPAHVLTLLTPPALWTLVRYFSKRKQKFRIFKLSLIAITSWSISSVWWVYPYLKLGTSAFIEKVSKEDNYNTLISLSQYFKTKEILLLRQSYLFGKNSLYSDFYSQAWIYTISILILFIVFTGIYCSRKIRFWKYLFLLLIFGWFICKGANVPFGKPFFKFIFSNFTFTQSLRNPYEKFGLIFLFPYSIFFSLGLDRIFKSFKKSLGTIITFAITVFSYGVLVWPLWTGDIYKSFRVSLPSSYRETNKYLDEINGSGKILLLPLNPGDAIKSTWGYIGIDPSEFLFDQTTIAKILRAKYFDEKYKSLYQEFIYKKDYSKELEDMGIKYLVLHNDLIPEASGASTSAQVRETFSKNPKINKLKSFGELEVYEYLGSNSDSVFTVAGGDPKPGLKYRKLSTTRYVIDINNAINPYILIFKETYNNLWEARIIGQKVEKHFIAYNYANAWEFDKKGSYTIDIVFKVWPWE